MPRAARLARPRRPADASLHKPRGSIQARVQQLAQEHFGIVCVDCAKARSQSLSADFYGKALAPPTWVAHNRVELDALTNQVRQACQAHDRRDVLVASEHTGRYHHAVRDAFRRAHFETRIVHPFTSQRFRQPADPDHQTDDHDLAAVHRATAMGFALSEPHPDETRQALPLLARHRRHLVHHTSMLACRIREHLDAAGPGYAALFSTLWDSQIAFARPRRFTSPRRCRTPGPPASVPGYAPKRFTTNGPPSRRC